MNVVTLRKARLVPTWVTVFGRVNHFGAEPGTQAYSAWACPLCRLEWVPGDAGAVNRHITWHASPCTWSRSVRWMPGWWLPSGDQRRLTESDIDIPNLSVRPSVRYVPVSDENGLTYRHSFFPPYSSPNCPIILDLPASNIFTKFRWGHLLRGR